MKLFELLSLVTCGLSHLVPKKKNRWIFGAWFGKAVSDNSRAMSDYVKANHPEIEIIWVTDRLDDPALEGLKAVKRNSLGSLPYILTAQVAVMNQGFGDFCAVNLLGGCRKVQLWHGVAWKRIVRDALPEPKTMGEKLYRWVFDRINSYDLYVAPSETYGKVVESAFHADPKQIIYAGQPRNAALFDPEFCRESAAEIRRELGLGERKLVMYMPTFRDKTAEVFTFCKPEIEAQLEDMAQELGFAIVEKSHFKSTQRSGDSEGHNQGCVYTMPNADAAKLLAAADVLITDYSSCFFDYLVRGKPVIHYVYDYEYYKNQDRGLYFTLEEAAAGDCAFDFAELKAAIRRNLEDSEAARDRREAARQRFVTFESPDSPAEIYKRISSTL